MGVSEKTNGRCFWTGGAALLLVLTIVGLLQYVTLASFHSLPAHVYGGDYYYQLGQTQHVASGGSPLDSATIQGALPGYLVLYTALVGYPSRWFGIDVMVMHFFFSGLATVLGSLIVFALCRRVFQSSFFGLVGVLLFVQTGGVLLKYTDFARAVMMPLFLLVTYDFLKLAETADVHQKKSFMWRAGLVGLVYGLIGITHSIGFIAASLYLVAVTSFFVLLPTCKNFFVTYSLTPAQTKKLAACVVIFLVGVSIALLWWFKPIFMYHGTTSPNYVAWNNYDFSSNYQLFFVSVLFHKYFFDFTTLLAGLKTLLNWLGIASLLLGFFCTQKSSFVRRFVGFSLCSAVLIVLHYFITQNVFGMNVVPNYFAYLLLEPVLLLVAVFGVQFWTERFQRAWISVLVGVLVVLLVIGQGLAFSGLNQSPMYVDVARENRVEPYKAVSNYLFANTNVSDVILTTKGLGFALNAFSGRKLVVARRAQNDPFLDMDPRELDQAIMLYGKNKTRSRELLHEYNVSYVYWDVNWERSEYLPTENANIVRFVDPLLMFYSEKKEQTLADNSITYLVQDWWVDPSLRSDNYKKFKLLFVLRENYFNSTQPWSQEFDQELQEVWRYEQDGILIAMLKKVTVSSGVK